MRRIDFLVFLRIVCVITTTSATDPALRVINGRDAAPGEYPYAVRIEHHSQIIFEHKTETKIKPGCTGSAITATWILTAAHCLEPNNQYFTRENVSNFILERRSLIRYGNPHLKPSANNQLCAILKGKAFNKHQGDEQYNGDIGLMNTEPIIIEKYAKLSGMDYASMRGHEVALIGFGIMKKSPNVYDFDFTIRLDKPLQVIEKALLISCDDKNLIMKICSVPVCGVAQTVFYGDSGAPVVHASGVMGVVSTGTDNLFQRGHESLKRIVKPGILQVTPVSPYMDWLLSTIST